MTQSQEDNQHSFQHIFIGYRASVDFHGQSDIESDENDQHDQIHESNINENYLQYFDSANHMSYDHFSISSNSMTQDVKVEDQI